MLVSVVEKHLQAVWSNCFARINAECRFELLCMATFLKHKQTELLGMMHTLEEKFFVGKAIQIRYFCLSEEHFAELFRAKIRVNTPRGNHAATSTGSEEVVALFDEQLVKIDI